MRFGSSVPGLYIAHPGVHDFRAAKVERDQAEDYGRRNGMSIAEVERRLASVLNYGPASVDEAEARRCDRLRFGAMRPGFGFHAPESRAGGRRARKHTYAGVEEHGEISPPIGAALMNFGPDSQAFVKRWAHQPSLSERSTWLVLFVALRARFLGAGLLLAGMRVLPGGDRLRLRG